MCSSFRLQLSIAFYVPMKLLIMEGFTSIWTYIFSVFISIVVSASSQRIHEIMTREELVQTFGRHENLPEYEVIPIYYSHLDKRSVNGSVLISLKPFGKNLELWLEPTDGMLFTDTTPVYGVSGYPDSQNVTFRVYTDAFKILEPYLYTDYRTYTTLALDRSSYRQKRMTGVIGSENLVISPLQKRLISNVKRHRRSIDNIPESQQNAHHYHIVFKSSLNIFNNIVKPLQNSLKKKRAIQDTIYPEILVIVDYNLYKVFNEKWQQMLLYLMGFWNGVDLLFRSIQNPNFRLNIAAIIIAETDYALSYVASNCVGHDKLKIIRALADSQSWLYENLQSIINTEDYDVAVTMTSLNFCDPHPNEDTCDQLGLGITYQSSACQVNDYKRKVLKTVIIQDIGGFSGIFTATHELGHTFGSSHDGIDENSQCPVSESNMMSPKSGFLHNGSVWSQCSLNQFRMLLETTGKCLFNKPRGGHKLVRILAGKMKDANEQCKIRFKTKAVIIDATICERLFCYHPTILNSMTTAGPAADGTPCDNKKICFHSKCLSMYEIHNT